MPTARRCHHTPILPCLMSNLTMENGGCTKTTLNLKLLTFFLNGVKCLLAKSMTFYRSGLHLSPPITMSPHSKTTMIYTLQLMPLPFLVVTLNGKPSIFISIMMKNFHPMCPTGRRRSGMSGTVTLSS